MSKPTKTLNAAIFRGALVVLIAALTAAISGVTAGMAPLVLALTVTLQALIALRGFADQSLSDVNEPAPDQVQAA